MSKDFVRASEIQSTLNNPGWGHIDAILESVVHDFEKAALTEEDEQRIVARQREARIARQILDKFRSRVRLAGSPVDGATDSDDILVAM